MTKFLYSLLLALVLAATPALRAQTVEVFGLTHAPLGGASLAEIPSGSSSTLLVSNIGSSGQDGVRVTAGPSGNILDFLCVEVDEPAVGSPNFLFEAFDTGMPLTPVATGRLRELGSGYRFSALFASVRGGGQRVSVYDDGDLVGEDVIGEGEDIGFGAWPTIVDPHKSRPLPFPFPDLPVPTDSPVPQDGPWPVAFSLAFDQSTQVGLPSGSVSGSLLVIEPVQTSTYEGLRRVEITAAGVDKFTVRSEMIGAFGLPHVALGEASFDPEADRLTVGNLSQGGGVFVGGLPGRVPVELEFLPFSLGAGQEGYVKAFRNPQGPGDPGEVAAELRLRQAGGPSARSDDRDTLRIEISPRASQASDARAEVLEQNGKTKAIVLVPIDDLNDFTTAFNVAPLSPRVAGGSAPRVDRLGAVVASPFPAPFPTGGSGFTGRFDGPVTFTFADGTVVDGFGFKLSLVGEPFGNLSGVSFDISNGLAARSAAAGGLDEIVIVDEALAFPIVGVSARPISPPVVIGPGGGSFQWRFRGANASASPVAASLRTEVVLPNGTVLPLLGPVSTTLPATTTVSRTFIQNIPAAAPSGAYVYRVQGQLLDSSLVTDAFMLKKLPALPKGRVPDKVVDWSIVEVPDPEVASESAVRSGHALDLVGYPNPVYERATIAFTLAERSEIRLAIYDVLGREVVVLSEGRHEAGLHEASWDASGLASGLYLVRLETGGPVQTQRLTVVR